MNVGMTTALIQSIFAAFGGVTKLAESVSKIEELSISTAHSWLSAKGGIPKWRRQFILRAGFNDKVTLTAEMIAYLDPKGGIKPPSGYGESATPLSESAGPPARPNREVVFDAISGAGRHGMTPDECAEATGLPILSVRPRITELRKAGQVAPTGHRRKNKGGRTAIVWRARGAK